MCLVVQHVPVAKLIFEPIRDKIHHPTCTLQAPLGKKMADVHNGPESVVSLVIAISGIKALTFHVTNIQYGASQAMPPLF